MVARYMDDGTPPAYPLPNTRFSPSRAVTTTIPIFSHPLWEDELPIQPVPSQTTDAPTTTVYPFSTVENVIPNPGAFGAPNIGGGQYEYLYQPINETTDDNRYGLAKMYVNPSIGILVRRTQ